MFLLQDVKNPETGVTLARHFDLTAAPSGLFFTSDDHDFIQVGTWNYEKGKILPRHKHLSHAKPAQKTQEALVVIKGSVLAHIYDDEGNRISSITIQRNQCLVLLSGGHSFEVNEDGTIVFEAKNGPYFGAEIDRVRY